MGTDGSALIIVTQRCAQPPALQTLYKLGAHTTLK